jgi:hypothetical protein
MMAGVIDRVQIAAQAAVWTFLSQVGTEANLKPLDVTLPQPGGEWEVQLSLRRVGTGSLVFPGSGNGVPLQDLAHFMGWLPGGGLSDIERDVVRLFQANGNSRRKRQQIRDELRKYSESAINNTTARLARPEVGILDDDQAADPPGFHLTASFCRYLNWCDSIRSQLHLPLFLSATA